MLMPRTPPAGARGDHRPLVPDRAPHGRAATRARLRMSSAMTGAVAIASTGSSARGARNAVATSPPPSRSARTSCPSSTGPTFQVQARRRSTRVTTAGTGTMPSRRAAPRAPGRTTPVGAAEPPRAADVRGPLVPPGGTGQEGPSLGGRTGRSRRAAEHLSNVRPSPARRIIAAVPCGRWPTARFPSPTSRASGSRRWLLIRRFEERAGEMYAKAKVGGFLHLAIGEEATIVGRRARCATRDYLISTYRSHGHALARGTPPEAVMAELFGRSTAAARGRGGSMHMFDLERRFMGGYGIVGGNLPIAAGFGLAADLPRDRRRDALHVRRRRLQPGHVRRDDEPRRAVEAAGRLHGHEQPVRHGHGARAPLGRHRPPASRARASASPGMDATAWTSSTPTR